MLRQIANRLFARSEPVPVQSALTAAVMVDGLPVPPDHLRVRVHGQDSPEGFLAVGRRCAQDLEGAVRRQGRELASFTSILDFGCGCGRTLLALADRWPQGRVSGTDIDPEVIDWCREHLPFMTADVNTLMPPLRYADESFDFSYAISVFTHLDEAEQFAWLGELQRVCRPGGLVCLTVQGEYCLQFSPDFTPEELRAAGFRFRERGDWSGKTGDHSRMAFTTPEYVRERYAPYFEVLEYRVRGVNDHQDLVTLRKRG